MLGTQLKYDLLMFSRELFYMIFTIFIPPVTFLFLGQLYGNQTYAGNLSYAETYTPSFILLMTIGVIFFSFGFEQVANRAANIEKRIIVAPIPPQTLLISNILKSLIITSVGFFLVYALGIFVYQLSFQAFQLSRAYLFFIGLNAVLLILASALYALFQSMNAALIFSIVLFQIVMITGGFTIPYAFMPKTMQIVALLNPFYHMNALFIAVWNGQWTADSRLFFAIGYLLVLTFLACFLLHFKNRKRN